jgi:uncharacterized protein YndB with AHSA1/START domain
VETLSRYRAELSLPSDTEILVVRNFQAPKRLVFDAWSSADHLRRWYGCEQMAMPVCEVEFREGGRWRVVQRDDSGTDHALSGEYRDITRPDRLVFTERYENIPDTDHVVELTFSEHNDVTTLTMRIEHRSKAHRDGHLQAGMEPGLQDSLARLDALVMSLAAAE